MSASMKVCIVGSGGREHALAAACVTSGAEVVVSPGNDGISWSIAEDPMDVQADLFIIGPERPLVAGLADRLRSKGATVFGPGGDGANLEGSKAWMKGVLASAGVQTAAYGAFTDRREAVRFLDTMDDLFVVKTDGLADGKGVLVTEDRKEAQESVSRYLDGSAFGDAGRTVVIEEGLTGPEVSLLVVTDGERLVPLAPAQDHKRLRDRDQGPNTGGMGAFSPVPGVNEELVGEILERAVEPTLAELRRRGIDYRGVLYAGMMLTPSGPKVLEFNVRFGDPEAQVVLPRLVSSLPELAMQAAEGRLRDVPAFSDDVAVGVVMSTPGYPGSPVTGDVIQGLTTEMLGSSVFASALRRVDDNLVTDGGRVLTVVGRGNDGVTARHSAYALVDQISWPGAHYRSDIGAV